jgi:hypothetical protein
MNHRPAIGEDSSAIGIYKKRVALRGTIETALRRVSSLLARDRPTRKPAREMTRATSV